jgi:hypothetical protein
LWAFGIAVYLAGFWFAARLVLNEMGGDLNSEDRQLGALAYSLVGLFTFLWPVFAVAVAILALFRLLGWVVRFVIRP